MVSSLAGLAISVQWEASSWWNLSFNYHISRATQSTYQYWLPILECSLLHYITLYLLLQLKKGGGGIMSGLVRYISVLLVTDLKYMMMMMSVLVSWCFCVLEFLCFAALV